MTKSQSGFCFYGHTQKIMDFLDKGWYIKKVPLSKDTVKHVAHLARIELDSKELEKLSGQLKDILDFIDKLKELDVRDASPTSHILALSNVLRDDRPGESLPIEKALKNAPQKKDNFFVVPKVIE